MLNCVYVCVFCQVIVEEHPLVLGIRDIESVQTFKEKLKHAHRIMVVGNGGIATEIVYVCVCVKFAICKINLLMSICG